MDKAYKYIKRAAELSPDDAHILMHYGIIGNGTPKILKMHMN